MSEWTVELASTFPSEWDYSAKPNNWNERWALGDLSIPFLVGRQLFAQSVYGKVRYKRVRVASLCYPLTFPLDSPTQGNGNERNTKGESMVMPTESEEPQSGDGWRRTTKHMVNLSTNEQLAEILMILDVIGKNGGKNHVLLSPNKVRNTNYTHVFFADVGKNSYICNWLMN